MKKLKCDLCGKEWVAKPFGNKGYWEHRSRCPNAAKDARDRVKEGVKNFKEVMKK